MGKIKQSERSDTCTTRTPASILRREGKFMLRFIPNMTPCRRTRREFLWQVGGGFAGLALIDLLSRDGFFTRRAAGEEKRPNHPLAPKKPHFKTLAKHL